MGKSITYDCEDPAGIAYDLGTEFFHRSLVGSASHTNDKILFYQGINHFRFRQKGTASIQGIFQEPLPQEMAVSQVSWIPATS